MEESKSSNEGFKTPSVLKKSRHCCKDYNCCQFLHVANFCFIKQQERNGVLSY